MITNTARFVNTFFHFLEKFLRPHSNRKGAACLRALPGAATEQHQNGVHLQPPQDHGEREHQLAQHGESGEVPRRPYQLQAGAHITNAGDDSGEGGAEGEVVESDHDSHAKHQEQIDDKVALCGTDCPLGHRRSVQPHDRHRTGVDDGAHLPTGGAYQDQDAPALNAAAGGPGAGTDKGEHHQQHFGELRPQVIVGGGEPGGGHDGCHLEGRVPHTLAHALIKIPQVPGDGGDGHCHHNEEEPQLVAFQRLPGLAGEHEEVDGEVDGEQQHEHCDDDFDGGARVRTDGGVHAGKAAGACGGHGVGDRVVPIHPRNAQTQYLQHRESQINAIQDFGGLGRPGHQLALHRSGALRPDEEVGTDTQKGQQRRGED